MSMSSQVAAAALAGAAASTNPGTFVLERFFAEYEFNAKHQICNSDVSALSLKDLLELCKYDKESLQAWTDLSLGYTESRGLPALLDEIASCYSTVTADDVLECVPAEGILLTAQALVEPGDQVICVWPAYQSLFEIARARGATIHKWRARGGGSERLRFDVDDLEEAIANAGGKVKLITINFPHNPTGAQLTRAEQKRIADLARSCGAFVLSDEMYRGLEYEGEGGGGGATLPAMCDVYERGISLAGMSKVYALPGLRVGWLVSPSANGFVERAGALKDYTTICGSAPSEVLALMALKQRGPLLARSRRIVADGLKQVDDFFAKHPMLAHYHRPAAGPICYPCFRGEGLTAADVLSYARELVAATGVLILPGGACYDVDDASGGGAHFRVGLGRLDCEANLAVYAEALNDPRFSACKRRGS